MSTRPQRATGEAGQATAIFAIIAVIFLALGGLLYDGGQVFVARREAVNLARQAARAGAQELDETSLRAGAPALDPLAAEAAVRAFLDRRGLEPTSVIVEGTVVVVSLEITRSTPVLGSVRTVTATASARSVRGVQAESPG